MNIDDINKITKRAAEFKKTANSRADLYAVYLDAKKLYLEAYSECLKTTEISIIQKEFLSAIYLYESLDCEYAYELKQEEFEKCQEISLKQKKLVEDVLKKYSFDSIEENEIRLWHKTLQNHRLTAQLKKYFPIGKAYLEKKEIRNALFNFRRSEEILGLIDKSNLTEDFKLNYYLNSFILKFNISQCQYKLLTEEKDNTEFLERQIIKELLSSIEYNQEVIKISDDPLYKEGLVNTEKLINRILRDPKNSWQILYDFTHSEYLLNLMFDVDPLAAQNIKNHSRTFSTKRIDYFLFYTHGFNTRGEWKDELTEVITSNQSQTNINFILLPWDYGEFKIDYFLKEKERKRVLDLFTERYSKILDLYGHCEKKCLIAHSFGTYITGTALQKNTNFICNRIIFAGNILDPEYDWSKLRGNNQVEKVLIEQSTNDMPVLGAKILRNVFRQRWIGYAGRDGFKKDYDFINIIPSKSGHSGMLTKENMSTTWFNFLVT